MFISNSFYKVESPQKIVENGVLNIIKIDSDLKLIDHSAASGCTENFQ